MSTTITVTSEGGQSITLDAYSHAVFVENEPVRLTRLEFRLLSLLMQAPHRTFLAEELVVSVWGYSPGHGTKPETVRTTVKRLRDKIGGEFIVNVWGVGYRFLAEILVPVAA